MLIDFLQNFFNLILGLFLLRMIQVKLTDSNPNGDTASALGFLLH